MCVISKLISELVDMGILCVLGIDKKYFIYKEEANNVLVTALKLA